MAFHSTKKMKIGILTFHRTHNYGAVLQCFALQETLQKMGHKVWVINYMQPYVEYGNNVFYGFRKKIKSHPVRWLKSTIRYFIKTFTVGDCFKEFRLHHLHQTSLCGRNSISHDFDCYLIGSDQLWSIDCTGEVDPVFFGDFYHRKDSYIYGYAISGNAKTLECIGAKLLAKYAANFECISLRERSFANSFFRLSGYQPRIDIDPTLLTDAAVWNSLIVKNWQHRDYVLVYQARHLEGQALLLNEKAQTLAHKCGSYVLDLSSYKYTPSEFVTAFKYAKCVVTSSFHGTAFALIFNKQLCAVTLNDGHDARYVDLLTSIGAEKFLFSLSDNLKIVGLDYDLLNSNLEVYRQNSLQFLKNIGEEKS